MSVKRDDKHSLVCKKLKEIMSIKEKAVKINEDVAQPNYIQKHIEAYQSAYPEQIITAKTIERFTKYTIDILKNIAQKDRDDINTIKDIRNGMFCDYKPEKR